MKSEIKDKILESLQSNKIKNYHVHPGLNIIGEIYSQYCKENSKVAIFSNQLYLGCYISSEVLTWAEISEKDLNRLGLVAEKVAGDETFIKQMPLTDWLKDL